jgi:hypothetical protein
LGDARAGSPPHIGAEGPQDTSWLARGCLALVLVALFVIVVLPALLWAAGILIAGGR